MLVERLNLPRDPSRPPLVQASFTLEKAHRPAGVGTWGFFLPRAEVRLNVAGLRSEPYHLKQRTCQLDLEMVLEEGEGTIYGMLRYNADLFDEDTIARMAGHYQTLLEGAIADPDRRLSELPLLTPGGERQVLYEWNDTRADYPRDLCLHQLIEQQVTRTPEAVALRFGDQSLRYAELDARANRLAHRMHRLGVGPNTLAALYLERSPEMVTAILAVLKAGGAYVPLDPASPAERLRAVLTDTRAPVLLTQPHLMSRLPALETELICLDASEPHPGNDEESARPPASGVRPDDLAYVIYTSGSTGRPKGVMVEHRAICNTVFWHWKALDIRAGDRLLLAVPYHFDASICLLFPALAAGARLVLAEPEEDRDPCRLRERVVRERVTVLPVLPRMLQLMLDGPMEEAARTLRWVCSGGETMPPELPARLFGIRDVPLHNLYGPTEVAVDATCWTCRRDDNRPLIPIGRPIANVQAYVLDRHRRPVPVGVPGELYVGGAGLARGYLNDPQLTSERFVPNPFGEVPNARLYRTGDRCRWLADGSLEFLGRLDQQVKVRGHRVEVGEIETALMSHPAVGESVVLLLADAGCGQRLVAYVTARPGGESPSTELLRRHLKERLPEYMMPSAFVVLPELPRTPSGKVDRKALPAPLAERPETAQPYLVPRTPLEERIAGLWREVLRLDRVGVLDNFFELGGNSIQAAVLIHRLQEQLGRQIYTIALFDSPTIAGLASYLDDEKDKETRQGDKEKDPSISLSPCLPVSLSPCLVPLQPNGSRPPLFMVHPPGGIVVCYQPLAHRLGQDRPFYGIRARGLQGEPDLPARMEDMAAEYVAAVREAQAEGPYHLGGWSVGGVVAFEMARQLLAQGQSVGLLALLDTTLPLNPANPRYAEEAELSAREYGLDITLEELDRLGPDEQLPYLWQHVQRLGLVESDTPLPLVQQILDDLKRLFHAHIRLANDYQARPYAGRITMFRPSDSPVVACGPVDRGWGEWAEAVDVQFVPGHHHTMVKEPHVQVLARQLQLCLRQAEGG
jgi:amino acid adenylation domain-containing protein